ncbi:hypothetical protein Y1Q_0019600 [Alligator mississippiensis]|uniref:Uncharacterized protein n=1 Tax=Alligator mississippiensis TaxID=8496 RepID=A0A151PEK6_ALLMI|nr:hypothetical protein Y1Q_0019600 [Alligator mississippiensis]
MECPGHPECLQLLLLVLGVLDIVHPLALAYQEGPEVAELEGQERMDGPGGDVQEHIGSIPAVVQPGSKGLDSSFMIVVGLGQCSEASQVVTVHEGASRMQNALGQMAVTTRSQESQHCGKQETGVLDITARGRDWSSHGMERKELQQESYHMLSLHCACSSCPKEQLVRKQGAGLPFKGGCQLLPEPPAPPGAGKGLL